jgi:hypothetical protein
MISILSFRGVEKQLDTVAWRTTVCPFVVGLLLFIDGQIPVY